MRIREEIMKTYSANNAKSIAHYAITSNKHFAELMDCYASDDSKLAQRAAWSVGHAAELNPKIILPYIGLLVARMQQKDVHPAVVRNAVRILEQIDIPEAYHGEIMNACFRFIESPSTPAAIKAFSLTTVYRLSMIYPDIQAELKLLIEELWDQETPAFKSRGRKILKLLEKKQQATY
jgi:hypothetical protein